MTTYLIIDAETTSLEPSENGRVTCISTYNKDNGETKSFIDLDESKILRDFWDYVKSLKTPTLVTFNGSYFDIPYVVHRSIVRNEKVFSYKLIDLRLIANSFFTSYDKKAKGSLAYWAAVLGIEQKTPPGAEMINLFMEKKLDEIKCHCQEDVLITNALFDRLKEVGLIYEGIENARRKY